VAESNRRRFWSSIPGLLTGTAGVLTALVGLTTVLIQLDVIGDDSDSTTTSVATTIAGQPGGTTGSTTRGGTAAGRVSINPTSATFNRLLQPSATFKVRNEGSQPTTVSAELDGRDTDAFQVDASACDGELVRGITCDIVVKYQPPAAGGQSARLVVSADGADPVGATLTGN
jgi:hypothetical protein